MRYSINLDREIGGRAKEIEDVRPDWVLTTKNRLSRLAPP
jgi:hypothetical protein